MEGVAVGHAQDMLGYRVVETELAFLCQLIQLMMTAALIVLVLKATLK